MTIPDDVMKAAHVTRRMVEAHIRTDGMSFGIDEEGEEIIARAIMAERERWLAPFVTRDGANEMEAQDAVERLAEWMFMNNAMFNYVGSSFDAAAIEARRVVAAAAAIRKGVSDEDS